MMCENHPNRALYGEPDAAERRKIEAAAHTDAWVHSGRLLAASNGILVNKSNNFPGRERRLLMLTDERN